MQYCTGGSATINGSGAASYEWSTGATTPGITVTQGTYDVTGTDANGCTATANAVVTEASSLAVSITGTLTVCPGETTTLTATGGTSYEWSNGNVADSVSVPAGSYTVIASDASCTGTASTVVTQTSITPLNLSDVESCSDSTVTLDAGSGYASYVWSSSETTQVISTQTAGDYTVTATDTAGCTVSGTANVTLKACNVPKDFTVFIPNAFTPNGDGNNEKFQIYISDVYFAEIKVFNRIGEKVFETNNVNDYWDGTYKGQSINTGCICVRCKSGRFQ